MSHLKSQWHTVSKGGVELTKIVEYWQQTWKTKVDHKIDYKFIDKCLKR